MFSGIGKGGIPVIDYFRNSLIISMTSTVIAIAIGMAGGYAFARFRFRGKSGWFLGLMLTRTVPGIALSLPLFFVYARLGIIDTPFRPDPRLCRAQRAVHHLADRRLLPAGAARPRGGRADRRLHALAGVLAGGVPARRTRHRLGGDLRLPDLMERVRAGLAAHPLGQLQDAAGRPAGLYGRVHHRLARHVRAGGRDDHPGADPHLHRPEAPRRPASPPARSRADHGNRLAQQARQALRLHGDRPRHRPRRRRPRIHRAGRTVRLRQVDDAADDRRAGRDQRRRGPDRRPAGERPAAAARATSRWCSSPTRSTRT